MKILRKILTGLIIFILVPLVLGGTVALATINTYLNVDFYQSDAFQDAAYEAIISEAAYQIGRDNTEIAGFLSENEIEESLKSVITPDVISGAIEEFFTEFSAVPFPEEITISTSEVKQNLPIALNLIREKINDPIIANQLDESLVDYIPHELSLNMGNMDEGERTALAYAIRNHSLITYIFLGVLALFLVLIALLIWKPCNSIAGWEGWTLFLSGAPVVVFGALLKQSFNVEDWSTVGVDASTAKSLLEPFIDQLMLYGYILTGAGLLGFFLYFALRCHKTPSTM